jgi:acetylornithine deacetylase/succinyl-diaminopimelate desuccinylase-like protein
VGILKGAGGGLSLMFNGHTDAGYTGTEEDLRIISTLEPPELLRGRIEDGMVYGLGISNMKGGWPPS